jgi:hypothetical protein
MDKQQDKQTMRKMLIFVLAIFFWECTWSPVTIVKYDNVQIYKPTEPKNIKVFVEMPSEVKFVKLAEVTVENVRTWQDAVDVLKDEAAKLGGDMVYVVNNTTGYMGAVMVTGVVVKLK